MQAKKSLGQHWLNDPAALQAVADAAEVNKTDFVLEVGPGLGTLTKVLAGRAKQVIAVELDEALVTELEKLPDDNLQVIRADILKFDLTQLPPDYKVVANIPYYLTSHLLRVLIESTNPPKQMALLLQKEVAQRVAAGPGQMGLLSVSVQLYYQPTLHQIIPATLFIPPPKVDSQIISLVRRGAPLFQDLDENLFFRVIKAGFASRRKKLRSSLAAGLQMDKSKVDELLKATGISGDKRAQELSLEDWFRLSQ